MTCCCSSSNQSAGPAAVDPNDALITSDDPSHVGTRLPPPGELPLQPSSSQERAQRAEQRSELTLSSYHQPANLIGDLCAQFYKLGWVTGTGGGISIRQGSHVFLAPSGVQKERIRPEHVFVLPYPQAAVPTPGSTREFLRVPTTKGLKESACTPLFWNAFRMRDAGACIHTHSQHAGQSCGPLSTLQPSMCAPETDALPRCPTCLALSHGYAALAGQRVHDLASGGASPAQPTLIIFA